MNIAALIRLALMVALCLGATNGPAQATDREALLGWTAVGIDARTVIKANGAIHCVSMQIPR